MYIKMFPKAAGNPLFTTPTPVLLLKLTQRSPFESTSLGNLRIAPTSVACNLASRSSPHRKINTFGKQPKLGNRVSNAAAMRSQDSGSQQELLIVGPGVLGSYLGTLWNDEFGDGLVFGQTKTETNHEKLKILGINPMCKSPSLTNNSRRFANVVYCAPPSGSENYVEDIQTALDSSWDGTGNFVFTSSAGVYNVDDGSACDETAPVIPLGREKRTDALLMAEQAVLDAGGCVVRLVGLYHRNRGPHTFFLKQGQVPRWGGAYVNLIHYEDAARLVFAVASGKGSNDSEGRYRSRVFLGCDGVPVTFSEMMQSIEASGQMPGKVTFTGEEGSSKGKRMNNNLTRQQLGWEPVYGAGIQGFFAHGGNDWYSKNSSLVPGAMPHQ